MNGDTMPSNLSIQQLPFVLTQLFERAEQPLLPGEAGPLSLFVRYLRRKPGRGLAVIYNVDQLRAQVKGTAHDPHRSVSLTLDEKALEGASICFSAQEAQQAHIERQPSGVLEVDELGLAVQAFPADSGLPALAQSCAISDNLFQALEAAAQLLLQRSDWRLITAQAIPVRYKPGNRCVIRYLLNLQDSTGTQQAPLTIFGKVYGDPSQASSVQMLMQLLYTEQEQQPFLPRPLGVVQELGLTLNEAIQPPTGEEGVLRTGTRALQPTIERGRGGEVVNILIPREELRLTAQALARLHTSSVQPAQISPRTGAKEAKRARERAALITSRNPSQAERVQALASELSTRLETAQPEAYRPAHGGFKASQLLFHSHKVFVVDFDGFCLADPALDVGYFLAYLRPSGLWYQRPGMREWFTKAADEFILAYTVAMQQRGIAQSEIHGILERSHLYEAALLFKIATRRVNRLNSPRSRELAAMLDEIAQCMADEARRGS